MIITNTTNVRSIAGLPANLADEYLQPSMLEAQTMYLLRAIGSALLSELERRCAAEQWVEPYTELRSRCEVVIAYKAAAECCLRVSLKVVNAGVSRTTDEQLQAVSREEVNALRSEFVNKADYALKELQMWLCANRSSLPELDDTTAGQIHSQLTSAASCGLWLGGARGKEAAR